MGTLGLTMCCFLIGVLVCDFLVKIMGFHTYDLYLLPNILYFNKIYFKSLVDSTKLLMKRLLTSDPNHVYVTEISSFTIITIIAIIKCPHYMRICHG